MSKGLVAFLVCLVLFVILPVVTVISSYISYANYGNRTEVLIKATYEDNQNVLAQYGQKIAEMVQVPTMYAEDLKNITIAAIQGRYGEGGSKAVFHFVKEQNPTLDPKLYQRIEEVIESGRNDFQKAQTRLIDQKRSYQTELGNVISGFWLRLAGYPKINLDDYKTITTDRASEAFKTGKEQPLKLR